MDPKTSETAWLNPTNPFIKVKEIGAPSLQKYLSHFTI